MTRERTPEPGVTWEQQLRQVEQVVSPEDGGESPFGWREPDTTVTGGNEPLPPRPNRAARRATKRKPLKIRLFPGTLALLDEIRDLRYPDAPPPSEPAPCRRSTCLTPGCGDGCGYR